MVKIITIIVILAIGLLVYSCCKVAGDSDEKMGIK
jgi:MFS-type transporter involved in bile tolerance (Atg22 family)